jgi:hypothetical protein
VSSKNRKPKKEIEETGYFEIIEHKTIKNVVEYNIDNYIKLLKTFSDHSNLTELSFEEIQDIIKRNGNKIKVKIIVNLEIAEKV